MRRSLLKKSEPDTYEENHDQISRFFIVHSKDWSVHKILQMIVVLIDTVKNAPHNMCCKSKRYLMKM